MTLLVVIFIVKGLDGVLNVGTRRINVAVKGVLHCSVDTGKAGVDEGDGCRIVVVTGRVQRCHDFAAVWSWQPHGISTRAQGCMNFKLRF